MSKFDYSKELSETSPYKKKSTGTGTKKSKHKHVYEPCVLAYPEDWWNKTPSFRHRKMRKTIRGCCLVCGKLGNLKDDSRWYYEETSVLNGYLFPKTSLTKEGEREMNPATRTLPYFEIDDLFAKFVELKE